MAPRQTPFAALLGCADARVPLELVFSRSANDAFAVRVAGNVLGAECVGSLDFAVTQLPSIRVVAVVGHTGCGAVGAMEGAVERTIAYAKERQAFGGPILQFQNTRFKLAEQLAAATAARAYNDACIAAHLKGELTPEMAAMNKFWLSDLQGRVLDECLQLFGGYGYMMEYPVAEMWTDARVQRIYGGTNEIMKEIIGRAL